MHRLLRSAEPELALLPQLVDHRRGAIDVGAHLGVYTDALRSRARHVFAIEPNPELAAWLMRAFPCEVTVFCAAASNRRGRATLRVPPNRTALGAIDAAEPRNAPGRRCFDVERVRLDDLAISDVGFIKIDVEGHELAVLEGARALIVRHRPNILVEAEERHRPRAVETARRFLEDLGYQGRVLREGRLTDIAGFDPARDQALGDRQQLEARPQRRLRTYLNNFVFTPG